jgi:hypothetical protein
VNTHRSIAAIAGFGVAFVASQVAHAQQPAPTFGARHQVVFSAEHLAGVTRTTAKESSEPRHDMWLFGAPSRGNPGLVLASPYSAPRAAVDFFVTQRFSIGTSVLLSKLGFPSIRQVVLGPRVGTALPLSARWSLWGRLGFTYVYQNDYIPNQEIETKLYAITVDAPFVATIGGNFFLSVVPTANFGVGGSMRGRISPAPNGDPMGLALSRDTRQTELGLQAALGGFL